MLALILEVHLLQVHQIPLVHLIPLRTAAGEKVNEVSVAVSLVDANGNLFIARA